MDERWKTRGRGCLRLFAWIRDLRASSYHIFDKRLRVFTSFARTRDRRRVPIPPWTRDRGHLRHLQLKEGLGTIETEDEMAYKE